MTQTTLPNADPAAYAAAREAAVLHDAGLCGRVRFTGDEHLDFLHRMSTNHVSGLAAGAGLRTVFCDSRGRILDLAVLARGDDAATMAFVGPGRSGPLLAWLDRYHFSEAIEWQDRSAVDGQWELRGPAVGDIARQALGLGFGELAPFGVVGVDGGHAQRIDGPDGPGLRLWGDPDTAADLAGRLRAAGAVVADADTWEVLRVEAGRPAHGRELTDAHNPWEAGLTDAVHMNKGCYIGQEVIARLDTYQKVKQRLVGLRLAAPVDAGAVVQVDGREAGVVTSVAASPRWGCLGLAYVRSADAAAGTGVVVHGQPATVCDLPFDGPR